MGYVISVCNQCESLNRVERSRALIEKPTCGKCKAELPIQGLATEVSASGLKRILGKSDKPVIVDFWAAWCGPCRMYSPIFERASTKNEDAIFLKIDTDANPQLSSELGIRGVPTTIVFKNGREYRRESGVLPEHLIPGLWK